MRIAQTQSAAVRFLVAALTAVALFATSAPAQAELALYDQNGLKLNGGLSIMTFMGDVHSSDFAGSNTGWYEGTIEPSLSASYNMAQGGTLYGEFSAIASKTLGDGDATGLTNPETNANNAEGMDVEQAHVGWRSGNLFSSLGEDAIDISVGAQDYHMGDGFLIQDGNFDYENGTYWLAPHQAFRQSAMIRVNTKPLRGDLFFLQTDESQGSTKLYGVNLEYTNDKLGSVEGVFLNFGDSDFSSREGMNVFRLRYQGNPVGLEGLSLSAAYTLENGGDNVDIDANAWHAEIAYTSSSLPWNPTLTYRYVHFSGDDPATADYEGYDPLFYAPAGDWGTWYIGEITGTYYIFNSDENVNMLHLRTNPTEKLSAGVIFYTYELDQATEQGNKDFSQEINVFADYAVNDNLFAQMVYGYAQPDDALTEMTGGTEDAQLLEIGLYWTF